MSADEFDPTIERLFAQTPHFPDSVFFEADVAARLHKASRVRSIALSAAGLKVLRLIPFRDLPHPHETGAARGADRGAEGCALAEIEGFLTPDDPRLKNPRADLLGAYAEPESLP